MNLNKQIQTYRKARGYSQETLAEKLYVSRQTVSNWETGHAYPDLENLMLLSALFDVTLDDLVKGDVDLMKDAIHRKHYYLWSTLVVIALLLMPLLLAAGVLFWRVSLLVLFSVLLLLLAIATWRMENILHSDNLQTYTQILRFLEPKRQSNSHWFTLYRWMDQHRAFSNMLIGVITGVLLTLMFMMWILILKQFR